MKKSKTLQVVQCGLFTALVAIGAFIQIPVPYMDYFTLQFLFVILWLCCDLWYRTLLQIHDS